MNVRPVPTEGPRRGRGRGARRFYLLLFIPPALIALIYFLAHRLLFHPDPVLYARPDDLGLVFEDVYFPAAGDGTRLHGWFLPAAAGRRPEAFLLFLHGNAGNISHRLENLAGLNALGLAVFIFDYRGYGLSQGRPSEKGTFLDARGAWRWLAGRPGVDANRIVFFGRSLGGAVAVDLGLEHRPRALILESTFTSVRDMAARHFPLLPHFLVPDMYDSLEKIGRVTAPVLFVHGARDDLVPLSQGRRLYEAHPGPKDFYLVEKAGHNDTFVAGGGAYYRRLLDFIRNPAGGKP
ncbi:MAG: alpha/beta hydrolase [Thermodesulfobacteriota bacterium]